MSETHKIGSRFYIVSNDNKHPSKREKGNGILLVMSHGYYDGGKDVTVKGVGHCAFYCRHGETVEPSEVEGEFENISPGMRGSAGFYEDKTPAGKMVKDYALIKGLAKDSKKRFKGKNSYEFVNADYVKACLPSGAAFDIACMHNHWYTRDRTTTLGELFQAISQDCPGVYERLYCCFCREVPDAY